MALKSDGAAALELAAAAPAPVDLPPSFVVVGVICFGVVCTIVTDVVVVFRVVVVTLPALFVVVALAALR